MRKFDDNYERASMELEEVMRDIRAIPPHPDIPPGMALTGRQLYIQFCYRMAKFDAEFAQIDDLIAKSWLNVGLERMMNEFEKRLLADDLDRAVLDVFKPHLEPHSSLEMVESNEYVFTFDIPDTRKGWRLTQEKAIIWAHLEYPVSKEEDFPKWWPSVKSDNAGKPEWNGESLDMDWMLLTDSDMEYKSLHIAGPYTPLMRGTDTRFLVHRHTGGYPMDIYVGDPRLKLNPRWQRMMKGGKRYHVDNVTQGLYNWAGLLEHLHIDTTSDTPLNLPINYHNDVVDYTVDAYFESMFFHQFGKYSLKQARQDADVAPNKGTTASRQGKLDAVPPQRYRINQAGS